MKWRQHSLTELLSAELYQKGVDQAPGKISTDSRSIEAGDIFFALDGPRFKGADFCGAASEKGAAAVVSNQVCELADGCAGLKVEDPLQALASLAQAHRQGLDLKIVAVTGSVGKTTFKDMLALVLKEFGPCQASPASFNNHIGVPLSLLQLNDTTRYAVIEIGANHPGEIESLATMVSPDIAVITGVSAAHLKGFGSLDGVARAKSELAAVTAGAGGQVFLPADDRRLQKTIRSLGIPNQQKHDFAVDQPAEYCLNFLGREKDGLAFQFKQVKGYFPQVGEHNLKTVAAVLSVCDHLALDLERSVKSLADFPQPPRRLQVHHLPELTLIDDSYNANPRSMMAAFKSLSHFPRPWTVVLGSMGELGDYAIKAHQVCGRALASLQVDELWLGGEHAGDYQQGFKRGLSGQTKVSTFDSWPELDKLGDDLRARGGTCLVKGSRAAQLDQWVDRILTHAV